jgi:pimeloyl-ACP methyl ester carboxylesterase
MGTKRARDVWTDVNFVPEAIWVEGAAMSPSEQVGGGTAMRERLCAGRPAGSRRHGPHTLAAASQPGCRCAPPPSVHRPPASAPQRAPRGGHCAHCSQLGDRRPHVRRCPPPVLVVTPPPHPCPQVPTAHRGFLARSRTINIDQLHALAEASGKRLVLCGHSLGGAVATLCTLRLLRELEPLSPNVRWGQLPHPPAGRPLLCRRALLRSAACARHPHRAFKPQRAGPC